MDECVPTCLHSRNSSLCPDNSTGPADENEMVLRVTCLREVKLKIKKVSNRPNLLQAAVGLTLLQET